MPRISPATIRQARQWHAFLPPLLGPCRDLESAKNELNWLHQEAVAATGYRRGGKPDHRIKTVLRRWVLERAKGTPLQYVTGNQPFGPLEILCRKGVLIPRPETEAITYALCSGLVDECKGRDLKVLDLCTGTGCISLLMFSVLRKEMQSLDILGVDSSPDAIAQANRNLRHYDKYESYKAAEHVKFVTGDIFASDYGDHRPGRLDVIVANPPYISPRSFQTITANSVRKYEPITALVPPTQSPSQSDEAIGDSFYPRILDIAKERRARYVLLEVGDMEQAKRVASMVLEQYKWKRCSIWRDWPSQNTDPPDQVLVNTWRVRVLGSGNGRAVLIQIPAHEEPM